MKYTNTESSDLNTAAAAKISDALRPLLADIFALYLKTKNFHWHMSGHHFRDYHLMLDDQSEQILSMTDAVAERARKLGGTTLRSISDIARHQRLKDNNLESVAAADMLTELVSDNRDLAASLRLVHALCDEHGDLATSSLIENWIDDAEGRSWFLAQTLK